MTDNSLWAGAVATMANSEAPREAKYTATLYIASRINDPLIGNALLYSLFTQEWRGDETLEEVQADWDAFTAPMVEASKSWRGKAS